MYDSRCATTTVCAQNLAVVTSATLSSIDNLSLALHSAAQLSTAVVHEPFVSLIWLYLDTCFDFSSLTSEPLAKGYLQLLYCLFIGIVMVMVT